ncbi:MAG: hypothetical protein JW730_06865 [Anaerolineales bacterium]|nr:hypothetical protein [Anaerolineales bacterium]
MNANFKSNIDAMFAKIFPAAADAADEDHGGFNLGDLIVVVLDLVLLIYTGYRSWHFLSGSVADGFQILAIVGLWGLDIGMVAWSLVWMFGSTTRFQNWTSMSLFVIDLIGVFLTSIVDTLAYGNDGALPPVMRSLAWYGIPVIIGLNVLAGFIYHMNSPSTRKRRAERSQDEELGKQKEKGNLQLRRMNMQLEQAQDYTTKRASFLVAFAEIAEQNIAMSEIEAQMMARLNKAAGGQLGNLMTGAGLSFPGLTPASETPQHGIADKLKELKNKFTPKNETGDDALSIPPILEPASPEAVKNNGGHPNQDPQ